MTDEMNGTQSAEQAAVEQLVDAGLLDELMSRVEAGEVQLTGEGGFLPAMIKAVLERGLAAELTGTSVTTRATRRGGGRRTPATTAR